MSRFIDDVSTLAIEDCLISKLSTLFRSTNVLAMSGEDVSRLAGETQESSLERERLEAKREILETGLQCLKSLYKRRNDANHSQQDHVTSDNSARLSAMSTDRHGKLLIATNGAKGVPRANISEVPSHSPNEVEIPPPTDGWSPQAGSQIDMEAAWSPCQ